MTPAIRVEIAGDRFLATGLGWDHRDDTSMVQFSPEPVGIESLVGQEHVEIDMFDQRLDADHVVPLPGEQDESDQIAQGIDQSDDLCRQSAT